MCGVGLMVCLFTGLKLMRNMTYLADMFHALGRFIFKRRSWLRHFWVLCLTVHVLVHAIMFKWPVHDGVIWTPWKYAKTLSEPGSRAAGSWQDLEHFSRNFHEIKDRIESNVAWGCKRNNHQHKKLMFLPYLGQDLHSKKKVVGILAHVCYLDLQETLTFGQMLVLTFEISYAKFPGYNKCIITKIWRL